MGAPRQAVEVKGSRLWWAKIPLPIKEASFVLERSGAAPWPRRCDR